MPERETAKLLRRVTEEIWCRRRYELVDELIADDFVDHIEMPGLEETGRPRYIASVRLVHRGFSDYQEEIELTVADEDKAVSYARTTGTHDGDLRAPGNGPQRRFPVDGILRIESDQAIERWVLATP